MCNSVAHFDSNIVRNADKRMQKANTILTKYKAGLCVMLAVNPLQTIIYSMEKKRLLNDTEAKRMLLDDKSLLFNLRESDERVLVANSIRTISVQTLFSIAGRCAYNEYDMDYIFRNTIHICYKSVFLATKTDFTNLFKMNSVWTRIEEIVCKSLDILQNGFLNEFLELEIQVTPVLHTMFDQEYPIDAKQAMLEYRMLEKAWNENARKMKEVYSVSPDISESDIEDHDLLQLVRFNKRLEDKMKRFPVEVLRCRKEKVFISSRFRSIGTETFRITTFDKSIQNLPSELRRCLMPRDGNMLIEFDIISSQIYILALLANERQLIRQYQDEKDLYTYIILKVTGKAEQEVDKTERGIYKKVILQMLYGAGLKRIQHEMQTSGYKISCSEVRNFKEKFYSLYPAIETFCKLVRTSDYIRMPTGKIWYLKDSTANYKKLAFLLQSVESTFLRQVLVLLNMEIQKKRMAIYASIHDSLLIDTTVSCYNDVKKTIYNCFRKAAFMFLNTNKINLKEEIIYVIR